MMLKVMYGNVKMKIYDHVEEIEFDDDFMVARDKTEESEDDFKVLHPPYMLENEREVPLDEKIITPFNLNNKTMALPDEDNEEPYFVPSCHVVTITQYTKAGKIRKRIAFNYNAYILNDEGETVEKIG